MMDITLCEDKACPFKKKCGRYLFKPNPLYQSYFLGSPFDDTEVECDMMMVVVDIFDTSNVKKNECIQ